MIDLKHLTLINFRYYCTSDEDIRWRWLCLRDGTTDDNINVAGHRLSTGEMEELIGSHAAVAECAVVGIDDEREDKYRWACCVERWSHGWAWINWARPYFANSTRNWSSSHFRQAVIVAGSQDAFWKDPAKNHPPASGKRCPVPPTITTHILWSLLDAT